MKYRITEYKNNIGNTYFKLEKKVGPFWRRIQRPLQLAHGMTDPFTREEAMRLIEEDSGVRAKVISREEINIG